MQYMMMLIGEEPNFEELDPAEMQETLDQMNAYNKKLIDAGAMVAGNGLRERATARTVHFDEQGATTLTDGPFAETKEQLMGYWVIEAASLDEALDWARQVPMQSASIEVRPLVEEQGEDDTKMTGAELLDRVTSGGAKENA